MGRSTRALKTDLRDPDLRSGSMWSRVRLDTARTEQSCQIRIRAPACPCIGKNGLLISALDLNANTPPPATNPRSEQNTNTGSFELWAL